MPLPRGLARFNRVVTNRLARPLAPHLPGFGLVIHQGRSSGRVYETPLNCWSDGETLIIALTYGTEVDWLKNLRAAGGGEVVHRGNRHRIGPPRLLGEEGFQRMPALVRRVLPMLGVDRFAVFPIRSPDQPT